ncbi:hypothetical protein F0U62_07720 [Cystobacter fuscus]|nr:hypothetical protein F0U62_07720 [Cystobacter fuscus]
MDTLTHVLRVLLHTVAGESGPAPSLAHPWLESPPPPHRRTAAHPRGYRGTIHQPPKRAFPEVLDVRPYLLHRATVRALLEPLRPHVDEALQRLGDEGLSRERLSLVRQALLFPGRAEVALAWRHGVLEERGAELPASLVRLGCLLTPGVAADFGRLLALRGRLALDTHPEVMILAARLLAEWGPEKGLGWLEVAASLVPESQTALLASLFQAKVSAFDASRYDPRFEAFASLSAGWRMDYLRGLASGLSSDFLLSGFRLLDTLGMSRPSGLTCTLPSSSGPVPEECLLDLFDYVGPTLLHDYTLVRLWALCGEWRGFAEILVATPWRALSVEAASGLADDLAFLWESSRRRPHWGSAVRRLHPRLSRLLERIPASHQRRAVQMVFEVLGGRAADWSGPDWLESTTFHLVERLCGPPFATVDRFVSVLAPLLLHPSPEVRERFSRVSARSLLRLEEGCSRGDLVGLVAEGMRLLVARHAPLVLEALEACPETLVRTAQLLGTPHKQAQAALLEDFARHPWVREDPFQWPPGVLAASLREHCVDGVESPLPRKARLAWEAGEALTPGQTERALRLASTQLPRLRLQVLARGVLEFLRGSLEADVGDARVRHALQMARLVEGRNRRGLRRLLNHYFAGERDFIVHHPESRSWFARHPRVKPETWLTGPVLCQEVPGFGRVTLALERDALEVLRMGTYVGSCFGLNGLYAESAAAVALDVNKRVLYARDSRGSVLARQLLAISKDDALVPFFVYPKSAAPALQALFLDYDLAFAEALGLPLNDGDGDPEVEFVLSSTFWHDGAWDFTTPDDERALSSSPEPVSHP